MKTGSGNIAHLKMGLKVLAGNAHSSEAAILPGAAWRLVWALGTMQNEKGDVLVEGICGGRRSMNFTEMKIGYTGEGDMTIIPAEAYCSLEVVLGEGQTAEEACAKIRAHLDSHGASDVGVWTL